MPLVSLGWLRLVYVGLILGGTLLDGVLLPTILFFANKTADEFLFSFNVLEIEGYLISFPVLSWRALRPLNIQVSK